VAEERAQKNAKNWGQRKRRKLGLSFEWTI